MQVHIHDEHKFGVVPAEEQEHKKRTTTSLVNFSLVVCRHPVHKKFLLCQEFSDQGFWLPGGAVDPGEKMSVAALREALEESGLQVELKGLLGIEYYPCGLQPPSSLFARDVDAHLVRMRVVFYAEPSLEALRCNTLPKCIPDFESAGACWVSREELEAGLRLRGEEVGDCLD